MHDFTTEDASRAHFTELHRREALSMVRPVEILHGGEVAEEHLEGEGGARAALKTPVKDT